jgi:hypothetical protein
MITVNLSYELLKASDGLGVVREAIQRFLLDEDLKAKPEALAAMISTLHELGTAGKHVSEACGQLGLALRLGAPDGVEYEPLETNEAVSDSILSQIQQVASAPAHDEPVVESGCQRKNGHKQIGNHGGPLTTLKCGFADCPWSVTLCSAHNRKPNQTLALHYRKAHKGKRP